MRGFSANETRRDIIRWARLRRLCRRRYGSIEKKKNFFTVRTPGRAKRSWRKKRFRARSWSHKKINKFCTQIRAVVVDRRRSDDDCECAACLRSPHASHTCACATCGLRTHTHTRFFFFCFCDGSAKICLASLSPPGNFFLLMAVRARVCVCARAAVRVRDEWFEQDDECLERDPCASHSLGPSDQGCETGGGGGGGDDGDGTRQTRTQQRRRQARETASETEEE